MQYNWLLSAVTLLVSDVFLYQSKGSIDHHAVERLDLILKVAQQLQRKGDVGVAPGATTEEGKQDSTAASTTFLWLLRDHLRQSQQKAPYVRTLCNLQEMATYFRHILT